MRVIFSRWDHHARARTSWGASSGSWASTRSRSSSRRPGLARHRRGLEGNTAPRFGPVRIAPRGPGARAVAGDDSRSRCRHRRRHRDTGGPTLASADRYKSPQARDHPVPLFVAARLAVMRCERLSGIAMLLVVKGRSNETSIAEYRSHLSLFGIFAGRHRHRRSPAECSAAKGPGAGTAGPTITGPALHILASVLGLLSWWRSVLGGHRRREASWSPRPLGGVQIARCAGTQTMGERTAGRQQHRDRGVVRAEPRRRAEAAPDCVGDRVQGLRRFLPEQEFGSLAFRKHVLAGK
jgi:hypothetical protein